MTTDNSDFSTIGKRISASMKKYGISMRALANKLCITQPTVFKWCHDQSLPRLEQIAEMAGIFHVSPVWLAYGIREPDEGDRMLRLGSSVLVSALAGISGEGKLSAEDYLLVTVATDDMAPAISPGDTVIVNRTVRRVQESGVYLVNAPGGRMIR
ncbi:MAG: helix-turn-helix domain-containing protein, partial [Sutterella sp.]